METKPGTSTCALNQRLMAHFPVGAPEYMVPEPWTITTLITFPFGER